MIRITKLHLILMMFVVIASGAFLYQVYQEHLRVREEAARAEQVRQQAERLKREESLAKNAIAVAGEYWTLYHQQGRDVAKGQATLHEAKELYKNNTFGEAYALAERAVDELRAAPIADVYHIVQYGDSLWSIAAKPKFYNDGQKWPLIYKANHDIIRDPGIIRPRQKLRIPMRTPIADPAADFNGF